MSELKWVKLSTGFLRDEKIHFILKRYGHDSMVFWTGLLSECNGGVLEIDEEIFAETLVMDFQRFNELKKIFASDKFSLIKINNDGRIEVVNWCKYQYSESYGRVKQHRMNKRSNALVTPEKQKETVDPDPEEDTDIEREKEKSKNFTPPSLDEVANYCLERGNRVDAQRFVDFYSAKGWMVGKNKMKDWKAAVRTWEGRESTRAQPVSYGRYADL